MKALFVILILRLANFRAVVNAVASSNFKVPSNSFKIVVAAVDLGRAAG